MGTSIYQSIEILSKEKGIDPQIVLDAVKDAMLVAARKHFRTTEDLIAELDQSSGLQYVADRALLASLDVGGRDDRDAAGYLDSGCRAARSADDHRLLITIGLGCAGSPAIDRSGEQRECHEASRATIGERQREQRGTRRTARPETS